LLSAFADRDLCLRAQADRAAMDNRVKHTNRIVLYDMMMVLLLETASVLVFLWDNAKRKEKMIFVMIFLSFSFYFKLNFVLCCVKILSVR
jgi:hypothetical protein